MLGNSGYERRERDWYPTPADTSQTILPYLTEIGNGNPLSIWEPAAGDGAMLDVLVAGGHRGYGTDIHPMRDDITVADFLNDGRPQDGTHGIVTNPPYGDLAQEFCEQAVKLIDEGQVDFAAMLVRHEYDCASGKASLFDRCPHFAGKITLTFRPRWIADSKGSPRHNYAWLLWRKDHALTGKPEMRYAHRAR